MEKIWLKNYPPGVAAEINPDQYSSLTELIRENCVKFADRPAYENFSQQLTFKEVWEQSTHVAAYLQKKLGLKKGNCLAIMLPNVLQYPVMMMAALQLGVVITNVNPLYTERELLLQLQDSGAENIIVLANFVSALQNIVGQTKLKNIIVTEIGDMLSPFKKILINAYLKYIKKAVPTIKLKSFITFPEVLREGKKLSFDAVPIVREDTAFLQYTGGTTGVAKGAILTHRNLLANILQCTTWIQGELEEGKEVVVTALPLYHIFSLTACCLCFIKLGGLSLLITNPRDINGMIKELSKTKFTVMIGVNTLFQALLRNSKFKTLSLSNLKFTLAGGAPVLEATAREWEQATGNPITLGYGLTEASPVVTINPLKLKKFTGSIGLPVPSTDIEIKDKDGNAVPMGSPGELCVKGPQVMAAYYRHPEENAIAFDEEGWLHTGDITTMDEGGFLYLIDRKKDMILVSGFNVYPNEIEDVIANHPGVAEVAVIGIPNTHSGEFVKAFIVKKNPQLTEDEILAYCRKNLTGYKLPKAIEFREHLPKSNIGKVLRQKLREELGISSPR